MRKGLEWSVGTSDNAEDAPERRVPAVVPGAVQLDWARAEGWGRCDFNENWKDYGWMEDVFWSYAARLDFEPPGPGDRLFFVCKGVDYRFKVRLKGVVLHDQEGMFTPFEIDLTERARPGDEIEILVYPAPKSCAEPVDRVQANQSCKPAVSYGWDFHPRLIPLGIWDETYLETRPVTHVRQAETAYCLSDDLCQADVWANVQLSQEGPGSVRWRLLDSGGAVAVEVERPIDGISMTLRGSLNTPDLWWPNGQGAPTLYRSVVDLLDASGQVTQQVTSRVGFRRIKLVMHPGAWDFPAINEFPKSRSNPPMTIEVNGRRIFGKGSNWVAPDIFPGKIDSEVYRQLLDLARDANMNLLRCWGGATVNKDAFFEMCDERGLMVWQEFPLACNCYEGTPKYLRVLDQESRSIILRLRAHACLALWCGGNELFNAWSGMTDQDLALRLLNRNCYDLDPDRPFLMTSPVMGMGHGHYIFREPGGKEVYQLPSRTECTAYTEFGCGGPTPVELLRQIIPEKDLYPPQRETAWVSHHAFDAWGADNGTHLMLHLQDDYFGPHRSLEEIAERGALLQSEGLKCLFEEARRQKPRCSMALNWCFDEPWLTAANESIVNWPAHPKPAYYAVAGSLRPVLASAKISKYRWREGEAFDPELWLLNDAPTATGAGVVEVFAEAAGESILLLRWDHPALEPNVNLPGPLLRFRLPRWNTTRFDLVLKAAGHPEMDSRYTLAYVPATTGDEAVARALNQ